jgi:hypothetical protein
LLAHHYTQAGLNEQAVPYWQQAGQRAIERSAHVEAITHLRKGLELLATLPETPARAHNELQFHCVLGTSLIATRGFAAAAVEQTYARARELCQQLQDTQQLFSVFVGLWGFYDVRDQLPQARDMGEQLLALAHRQHDPGLLVPAHRMLGETIFWLGELGEARAHLEQSMALTTHSNTGPMASAMAMMPAPVASASRAASYGISATRTRRCSAAGRHWPWLRGSATRLAWRLPYAKRLVCTSSAGRCTRFWHARSDCSDWRRSMGMPNKWR